MSDIFPRLACKALLTFSGRLRLMYQQGLRNLFSNFSGGGMIVLSVADRVARSTLLTVAMFAELFKMQLLERRNSKSCVRRWSKFSDLFFSDSASKSWYSLSNLMVSTGMPCKAFMFEVLAINLK